MLSFSTEQRRARVGSLELGGQPGERPPVLFGTAFLGRQYWEMGPAARDEARALLGRALALSRETGLPHVPDVAVRDLAGLPTRLELVSEALGPGAPFAVDIPDPALRPGVLEAVGRAGLLDRCIYNSLNISLTQPEREALASNSPAGAILLAYNPRDPSTDGRVDVLETGAGLLDAGLVDVARDLGVRALLLDTGATPFGTWACETLRAIPVLKGRLGLPTGCALHNTLHAWGWMRSRRQAHPEGFRYADAAAAALPVSWGADLVLYGKVDSAPLIFPAVAFAAKLAAEGAEDYFGASVPPDHPGRLLP